MNLLVLGRGKTGALVASVAAERGHTVTSLGSQENANAVALTRESLRAGDIDVVIDFTTPAAVLENIEACINAGVPMVVGTTGWYGDLERVRKMVEAGSAGVVYAANFSVGVNLFADMVRSAAAALDHGYRAGIVETHHAQKKDAPSGTALMLQALMLERLMSQTAAPPPEIESVRTGDVVGTHTVTLKSAGDTITLIHEARSRRIFAEGAVLAAEWLPGRKGFYEWGAVLRSQNGK